VSADPNKPLPAARLISNKLFKTTSSSFDDKISNLVMAWGQLIDHDCTKTPTAGECKNYLYVKYSYLSNLILKILQQKIKLLM
jgi:hypothetical protein